MTQPTVKTCNKCKEAKPTSEFSTMRTRKGTPYLRSRCKTCKRAQDREYTNTQRNLETQIQSNQNWRDNNREYYDAWVRMNYYREKGIPVPFIPRRPGVITRPDKQK